MTTATGTGAAETAFTRTIACDGIFNLRDSGGYSVAGGGRLRTGRLFRSAQHKHATPDDLARIATIGFSTVVDLRGHSERVIAPCPRPEGFAAEVIAIDEETIDPAAIAAREAGQRGAQTSEEAAAAMRTTYAGMPFRPVLALLFARYFEALATRDGPVLVHCMAGKDRTGIAMALVHHILGVHRDDMVDDYLLTNIAPGRDAWIARNAPHVREHYGDLSEDAMRTLLSVDESFLDSAFAAMRAQHGSVDGYLEQALSVDTARREAIRTRLIA